MASNELVPILKRLKLGGVLQTLDLRVRQAVDDELDHHEFLERLLQDEVDRRDSRALRRWGIGHAERATACSTHRRTSSSASYELREPTTAGKSGLSDWRRSTF